MSYPPAQGQTGPARQRGFVPYLVGGCAVIGLCVLCAAVAGGGYLFYNQRGVTTTAAVPSVEYILDATSRMAQQAAGENDTRLNVARGVLAEIVRPSDPTITAGLRVFGSGALPAACSDTALLVPLAPASQAQISTNLLALTTGANADAAMSQAIISAIRDLAGLKGKHTLVVVTGGADSCNPQAGELIAAEAQRAGINMQLFMIGFQVSSGDGKAIKGVVDAAGGSYVEADNKEKLGEVIKAVQVYAEDRRSGGTSSVLATLAAAVGTQNLAANATPQPTGTIVAGNIATPTPSETASPSGNASATPVPTGAATQGSSGAGSAGQTACDHPYFPLRRDSTWTFSSDRGSMTWTVTDVSGDQNDANATMQYVTKDVTGTYHWHCTANGIESYDFGTSSSTSAGGTTFSYKVTNHSGVFLPPADQLTKGAQWDSTYTLASTGGTVSFSEDIVQHFTAAGAESVTAAGAVQDALRIDGTTAASITASGVGAQTFNSAFTYWLVRGIGPVQWDNLLGTTRNSSVLQSYSIP